MKLPLAITRAFNNIHAKMHGEPTVSTGIDGFEISVDKKDGSVGFYYEVSLRPTGKNPEYPDAEKQITQRYTNSLSQGAGYGQGALFIPKDSQWTGFEVIEDHTDGMSEFGRVSPPHHHIAIKAHYKTSNGEKSSMTMGFDWIRKSDYNPEAWKKAKDNFSTATMYL